MNPDPDVEMVREGLKCCDDISLHGEGWRAHDERLTEASAALSRISSRLEELEKATAYHYRTEQAVARLRRIEEAARRFFLFTEFGWQFKQGGPTYEEDIRALRTALEGSE